MSSRLFLLVCAIAIGLPLLDALTRGCGGRQMQLLAAAALLAAAVAMAAEEYPLGPDSQRREGVPRGRVTHHTCRSKVFPGTLRDYWVYVPAQYSPEKPACAMIFQDGGAFVNETGRWRVPVVFDNLIHKGEMPVTAGIFINPGAVPPAGAHGQARPNRSFEYDAVNDRYARLLLEEILPEVGRQYRLSEDPNDRALCGASSGGICSFTAAWFRPDAFRRVLSFVGSFTNLRGGDVYPSLIRKSEVKPLRVFLQSGKRDMNTYAGSWYVQNQAMAAALEYMGYDHRVALGDEGHNDVHGSSILPDALRWLWRHYPRPVALPRPPEDREWAMEVVDAEKGWEPVIDGLGAACGLASSRHGQVFFADSLNKRIFSISTDGEVRAFHDTAGPVSSLAFAPDGRLYACESSRIVAYPPTGAPTTIATGAILGDLVVSRRGSIYFTDPSRQRVWLVDTAGARRAVHHGIVHPSGIGLSPDGSLLAVADAHGRWVWSFQVQPDGSLGHGEPFYRLETPDASSTTGASGIAVDTENVC